ncbi:hypothetical protein C8R45DRAFT_939694 [Mycena sanguinolenta]|nr:hypothetical protein C8R45DRAFT_939694 [Mycena sanguinolenta]
MCRIRASRVGAVKFERNLARNTDPRNTRQVPLDLEATTTFHCSFQKRCFSGVFNYKRSQFRNPTRSSKHPSCPSQLELDLEPKAQGDVTAWGWCVLEEPAAAAMKGVKGSVNYLTLIIVLLSILRGGARATSSSLRDAKSALKRGDGIYLSSAELGRVQVYFGLPTANFLGSTTSNAFDLSCGAVEIEAGKKNPTTDQRTLPIIWNAVLCNAGALSSHWDSSRSRSALCLSGYQASYQLPEAKQNLKKRTTTGKLEKEGKKHGRENSELFRCEGAGV